MMKTPVFQVFECQNLTCRLRFPTDLTTAGFTSCPVCGAPIIKIGSPYANYQREPIQNLLPGYSLFIILDNLRSAENVGSIFRTANGAGVQHLYCCGTTPTPEHARVKKASLGAENQTAWSYHTNTLHLVNQLHESDFVLIALESTPDSISIFDYPGQGQINKNIAVILGNEISGIDPEVMALADCRLHIPMMGMKTSFNVAVATGIALYLLIQNLNYKLR